MKVTIAGAGISGSYLGRLLNEVPILFDNNPKRGCRCAWRVPYAEVKRMLEDIGIDLDNFVLCRVEGAFENKVFIPLRNFVVIDKPRLIEELKSGLNIIDRKYNFTRNDESLIVNAMGIPTGKAMFRLESLQEKTEITGVREKTVYGYINPTYAGYSWLFPLDEDGGLYHHGTACLRTQPRKLMMGLLSYYRLGKHR